MKSTTRPKVRPQRGTGGPCPEVARARALYLRELRRKVRDGSWLTPRRVETALLRMLRAVRDDLPGSP